MMGRRIVIGVASILVGAISIPILKDATFSILMVPLGLAVLFCKEEEFY